MPGPIAPPHPPVVIDKPCACPESSRRQGHGSRLSPRIKSVDCRPTGKQWVHCVYTWLLTTAALVAKSAPAAGAGLALVLAVDVSASVTADSYLLQRDGIARAFENPLLAGAISAVPGGIEALALEWSDPDRIAVTVGWTRLTDAESAAAFAGAVRATKRSSEGLT